MVETDRSNTPSSWDFIGLHLRNAIFDTAAELEASKDFTERLEAAGIMDKPLPSAAALALLGELSVDGPERAFSRFQATTTSALEEKRAANKFKREQIGAFDKKTIRREKVNAFLRGFGSVFDITGSLHRPKKNLQ